MISDATALQVRFVPSELRHRDGERDALSTYLSPIENGREGTDVLITGPSGTGKTTLAKYVLADLERATLNVRTGYVDCRTTSSASGVLHTLLRETRLGHDLPRNSTAIDEYLKRIRKYDGQIVFVLDEIDVLDDVALLSTLFDEPDVTLVSICIDEYELLSTMEPRVASQFRAAESLPLSKYAHSELVDIVRGRADAGLIHGAVDSATVSRIADVAAGDARLAITLLKQAAEQAVSEGRSHITPGMIDDVEGIAESDLRERTLDLLSTHQRLLYQIIEEHGEISASRLHSEYEDQSQNPKSRPTRRRYLASLERYDMIEKIGATKGRRYRLIEK